MTLRTDALAAYKLAQDAILQRQATEAAALKTKAVAYLKKTIGVTTTTAKWTSAAPLRVTTVIEGIKFSYRDAEPKLVAIGRYTNKEFPITDMESLGAILVISNGDFPA